MAGLGFWDLRLLVRKFLNLDKVLLVYCYAASREAGYCILGRRNGKDDQCELRPEIEVLRPSRTIIASG